MDRRTFLTNTANVTAATAATTTLATPAIAQSRKTMNIVSSWPRDKLFHSGGQRLADRIHQLSEGSLFVSFYPAGERVNALDVFDEVKSGRSQAYFSIDHYWRDKNPGWAYFASVPFGLTNNEHNAWIWHHGGQELWDELAGSYGLKCLMAGCTGPQMGGWFNQKLNNAQDIQGLKLYAQGASADLFSNMGATVISTAESQINANLSSGNINGVQWFGPKHDYDKNLQNVAKYYYSPAIYDPGITLSLGLNSSFWTGLSGWEQSAIYVACAEEQVYSMSESISQNSTFLEKLTVEYGVSLQQFSDGICDSFGLAASLLFEEYSNHSDISLRIDQSFSTVRKYVGDWMGLTELDYISQRKRFLDT